MSNDSSTATLSQALTDSDIALIVERQRGTVDARSLLVLFTVSSILTFTSEPPWMLLVIAAVAILFTLPVLSIRQFTNWAVFETGAFFFAFILPVLAPNHLTVTVGFVAFWMFKFSINIVLGLCFLIAVAPQEVASLLTRLRAPTALYVTTMVMVRYFPVALEELKEIYAGMKLRGLKPGFWAAVLHPLHYLEMMVIPFLLSATRIVDELAAAALLKSVGAKNRSTIIPAKFRFMDGYALCLTAVLLGAKGVELWVR